MVSYFVCLSSTVYCLFSIVISQFLAASSISKKQLQDDDDANSVLSLDSSMVR